MTFVIFSSVIYMIINFFALFLFFQIEDEGNHGNDETRLFILSSLAQSQKSRVACILCEEPMLVFDRYPLVDGSFFLSPKQHSTDCIEVSSTT